MANILVCEDEKNTLGMICKLLKENSLVEEIFPTCSGNAAVEIIKKQIPHILLLDIDLPDIDGIEVAKIARAFDPQSSIVFITGYPDYAQESFIVHPYDYILKPIDIDRFNRTINNLIVKCESNMLNNKLKSARKLPVRVKNRVLFLNMDDIIFIEKNGKDTTIHTRRGLFMCNENLKSIESDLGCNFYRTHKSYIINIGIIEWIESLGDSYEISFYNYDKKAYMSKGKYQFIKDRFL
ncbi:MAG: LytTR family DNA-binding domain-containing protein [Tepidanaerobacteraceae bacterium]|nr:LytTR family DNA-binding domain-containing protein [Tepidanaerobacteraceae bacterium]